MDKKKQVEEILLMPINVIGYSGMNGVKIKKAGKGIETTQSYYPYKNYPIGLDPDMSDFAIGFYEILYNDFLSNPILNGAETLFNNEFAGDTMNSFNTIANKVPEAGKSNKQRTKISEWPNYLQEYYYQYHCLANFWILPMVVGRKLDDEYCKGYCDWFSSDGGMQDYMDRFLKTVNDSFSLYKKMYATYFGKIDTFEDFLNLHFLNDVYVRDGRISFYSSLEPEEIVRTATDNIVRRAIAISNSEYMEELWKYFDSQGLFD